MKLCNTICCFLLFVICACQGFAQCSIDDLRHLCTLELAFDYCGSTNAVKFEHVGYTDEKLQFIIDQDVAYFKERTQILDDVICLEESARQCVYADFAKQSSTIASHLQALGTKISDFRNPEMRFVYEDSIARVEYSLVRIMQANNALLLKDFDIIRMLPSNLYCHVKMNPKLLVFRNMIIIGFRIKGYLAHKGKLPDSLKDIYVREEGYIPNNMVLDYKNDGTVWQLFYSGGACNQSLLEFNVYVPYVGNRYSYKWPYGECVWLSNDYAEKRNRLYQDGIINSESRRWLCKLRNGVLQSQSK